MAVATLTICFGLTSMSPRSRRGLVIRVAAVDLHALVEEVALVVQARVRLHHRGELLLVGGQEDDLVGDAWAILAAVLLDATERRLDEPVRVHPRVRRERANEADVRPLRRLDRADAAVVAVVDVTDVESGALARQAAGPRAERRRLWGELVERVRLLLNCDSWLPPKNSLLAATTGRMLMSSFGSPSRLDDRHALAHDRSIRRSPRGLLLDELTDGAHATVAEVVDVVRVALAVVQLDDLADDADEVVVGERALRHGEVEAELAVQLVAADLREVVAAEVEEQRLHEVAGVVDGRRVTRTQTLVDLDQTLVRVRGGVAVQRRLDVLVLDVQIDRGEERLDLFVGRVSDRAQQCGHRQLPLAVDLHRDDVLVRRSNSSHAPRFGMSFP